MHVRNVFLSWLSSFSGFSFPPLLRNYALNFVCKYPYQPITCLGNKVAKNIWWLVRVTLVVAFNFLPQKFGRWQVPMSGTLSFYECRFCRGDTMRWWEHSNTSLSKDFVWTYCTLRQWGCKNFGSEHLHLCANTHAIFCAQHEHSYPSHLMKFPS